MFDVNVEYMDRNSETMLSDTKISIEVKDGFLFLKGSQSQIMVVNLDSMFRVKFRYPEPQTLPLFKYTVNINYELDSDVELLFSSKQVYVSLLNNSVVAIKESDDITRLITPKYLKTVKVTTYTEKDL